MEYLTRAACYLMQAWAAMDLKTLIVLIGATWAFYKFLQRGELHPLVDLKISGEFIRVDQREFILCSMEIENVHLPLVRIEYCGLSLSSVLKDDDPSLPVVWNSEKIFPVFIGQEKVWSGETIRDKILLIAAPGQNFFRLEFRIGRKYRWYQQPSKWLKGSSSWSAVAVVQRDMADKAGAK